MTRPLPKAEWPNISEEEYNRIVKKNFAFPPEKKTGLWAKIKVIVGAAPTYLVVAAAVVPIVAEEVGNVLPAGAGAVVAQVAITLTGVLGAAIAIIRRVTPVLPSQRGIL